MIIFDFDGVLVDSEWIANQIEAEALNKAGYPITLEEQIKLFVGKDERYIRNTVRHEKHIELEESFFLNVQKQILQAFEEKLVPLLPDLLYQINTPYCIASSSPKTRIIRSLEITKQDQFFPSNNIFTAEQVAQGKPSPDLFLWAAKQMGVPPETCLVIEDSCAGIEAAMAANMEVIGFLGGSHARFDWYQQRLAAFSIPLAYTSNDLRVYLSEYGRQVVF